MMNRELASLYDAPSNLLGHIVSTMQKTFTDETSHLQMWQRNICRGSWTRILKRRLQKWNKGFTLPHSEVPSFTLCHCYSEQGTIAPV